MTTFSGAPPGPGCARRSAELPAPASLTTANVEIISQRLAAQVNRGDTEARVEHFCCDEQVVLSGVVSRSRWGPEGYRSYSFLLSLGNVQLRARIYSFKHERKCNASPAGRDKPIKPSSRTPIDPIIIENT